MNITIIEPTASKKQKKIRVCAYCRVSTEEEEQSNSLENQISYYEDLIRRNPDYEYAGIYHDFGISGFKEARPGFQKMMQAAREQQIDLIITKSVSRFCRNTDTLLKAVRELKDLGIGVFFELQKINTLEQAGELLLTVLAAFAQAESENYSALAKMAYTRKFEAGIMVHHLERSFGYRINSQGEYEPDPKEAVWVKKIFELCIEGYNLGQIAKYLNQQGVKTKNKCCFTESSVQRILENEIYKGDFQARKHYLNEARKEVKNRGDMTSWYVENDHTPIVSRSLWKKAQNQLDKNRKIKHEKSVVGDLNEEIYPHMNRIFCANCGYPLKRRVYSNGNKMSWYCYGQRRFHNNFCTGVVVPDAVIRSWGELPGNVYIRKEVDELGKATFKYVKESSWSRNHKKKERPVTVEKENDYPYQEHLFCRQCGAKLVKMVYPNGNVFWICSKYKRKGIAVCPGVRVPDEVVRGWGIIRKDLYIERKDRKDGTKNYCYSGKKRQDSIKQGRKK